MGDNLVPNGLSIVCNVFLLQVDVSQIIVDEAYEPNAIVDLLYSQFLAGWSGMSKSVRGFAPALRSNILKPISFMIFG